MKVCFAGTFNVIHKGHQLLIGTAKQIAGDNGKLFIGITTGKLLEHKTFQIPYEKRKEQLRRYLDHENITNYEIIPIESKEGLAVDGSYDVIIVSPETEHNAQMINEKRKKNNKNPLRIITIPHVLAEDNKPISATRILNQEIDSQGNLITKKGKKELT